MGKSKRTNKSRTTQSQQGAKNNQNNNENTNKEGNGAETPGRVKPKYRPFSSVWKGLSRDNNSTFLSKLIDLFKHRKNSSESLSNVPNHNSKPSRRDVRFNPALLCYVLFFLFCTFACIKILEPITDNRYDPANIENVQLNVTEHMVFKAIEEITDVSVSDPNVALCILSDSKYYLDVQATAKGNCDIVITLSNSHVFLIQLTVEDVGITTAKAIVTEQTKTETIIDSQTNLTQTNTPVIYVQPIQPEYLKTDNREYPLGVPISVLSSDTQPDDILTVQYQTGTIVFAVFASDPKQTVIAFTHNDIIIGYYILCNSYQLPVGYDATEMRDQQKNDTIYAVLVQKQSFSIKFSNLTEDSDTQALSKLAHYATNGIRAINGLEPYIWDEKLSKFAMQHSIEMAEKGILDHNGLDDTNFSKRLNNEFNDWQAFAENIEFGYLEPFSAINSWYNSKAHRSNILNPNYTHEGIGFISNKQSSNQYYGTQDFCKWWD